ncbi:hypothetical protein ACRALDRAFT_210899 [Sodiomyces alcalophilus JCM 7366]|uniref:uncharacterized protein n=1 Tax=Sodiomyces alcalophilus JCM 7366 TaxID=591952 RepID=UPI0039B4890C
MSSCQMLRLSYEVVSENADHQGTFISNLTFGSVLRAHYFKRSHTLKRILRKRLPLLKLASPRLVL